MNTGALFADSLVFLEAGFVSAVAFYLGLARHHSLWALAALAAGGLLLAAGLAPLLDVAMLGMLALAAAALSVLYVLIALYDFFFRHRDEYAIAFAPEPAAEPQQPEGLRGTAHRAIELLEHGDTGEALRILREATCRGT